MLSLKIKSQSSTSSCLCFEKYTFAMISHHHTTRFSSANKFLLGVSTPLRSH